MISQRINQYRRTTALPLCCAVVHVVCTLPQDAPTGVACRLTQPHGGVTGARGRRAVRCRCCPAGGPPPSERSWVVAHGTPTLSSHSSRNQEQGPGSPLSIARRHHLAPAALFSKVKAVCRCMGCLRPSPRPNPSIPSSARVTPFRPSRQMSTMHGMAPSSGQSFPFRAQLSEVHGSWAGSVLVDALPRSVRPFSIQQQQARTQRVRILYVQRLAWLANNLPARHLLSSDE